MKQEKQARYDEKGKIGIEPILKRDKGGKVRKYYKLKAGRLGSIDVPTRDARNAEDDFPAMGKGKKKDAKSKKSPRY